jgi:hypothetical protein
MNYGKNYDRYTRRLGDLILVPPGWVLHPLPVAIDPPGCGCTKCVTGEYVPLEEASDELLHLMLLGKIKNNTGMEWVSDPDRRFD